MIYDVMGRMQKAESRRQNAEGTVMMDVSYLPSGIYFLRVGTQTVKFIKQ
jgi:hypothetical protein